eukprot:scaffold1340_cov253-Pinguiococcus_pyrenoidosus.AAC.2
MNAWRFCSAPSGNRIALRLARHSSARLGRRVPWHEPSRANTLSQGRSPPNLGGSVVAISEAPQQVDVDAGGSLSHAASFLVDGASCRPPADAGGRASRRQRLVAFFVNAFEEACGRAQGEVCYAECPVPTSSLNTETYRTDHPPGLATVESPSVARDVGTSQEQRGGTAELLPHATSGDCAARSGATTDTIR